MKNKKDLGQFFTTNYEYILSGLKIPEGITHIIEPFCGNGDLLSFIDDKENIEIDSYDIEPKKKFVKRRDTLLDPPSYKNTFVLTNPPYLALNHASNKDIFKRYDVNDLYKAFLTTLLKDPCLGGILVVPLNFWCSIRKKDAELRKCFLETYRVLRLNVFEERVFEDTTYTVCSFQFESRGNCDLEQRISITLFPKMKSFQALLNQENNYLIGGDIYTLPLQTIYKIGRLVKGQTPNTNIVAKCIDDNENNKIGLKMVDDDEVYLDDTPNRSARTYATLVITPAITTDRQKRLVDEFNAYFNRHRDKYDSLFLTNYRESKGTFARKRISFELLYDIVGHLLVNYENPKDG